MVVGVDCGVDALGVGVGVAVGVFEGVGAAFFVVGVGEPVLSVSQLTTCICGSAFEVSKTQRCAEPSARFFRTSAPAPSVEAGVRARSWFQRGTRMPWSVKS